MRNHQRRRLTLHQGPVPRRAAATSLALRLEHVGRPLPALGTLGPGSKQGARGAIIEQGAVGARLGAGSRQPWRRWMGGSFQLWLGLHAYVKDGRRPQSQAAGILPARHAGRTSCPAPKLEQHPAAACLRVGSKGSAGLSALRRFLGASSEAEVACMSPTICAEKFKGRDAAKISLAGMEAPGDGKGGGVPTTSCNAVCNRAADAGYHCGSIGET